MKNLLTISASYIDQSTGPIIHYIELWNEFNRLFADEYKITGISYYLDNEVPVIDIKFNNLASHYLKIRYIRNVLADFRRAIWLLFKIRKFDIVYTRMQPLSFFTSFVVILLSKNLVLEYNGTARKDLVSGGRSPWLIKLGEWQETLLARRASLNIAVSKGIASHIEQIGGYNTRVINNGVASFFFEQKQKKTDKNKIKIVYVGTFTPWDGAIHILKLAKKFPEVEFYLYGDGMKKQIVEKVIKTDNIFLPGLVNYTDLPSIYSQFDAGIVLYTFDRNDMVLSSLKTLEYLACGLPVFTTAVPGQEFIADNEIGVTTNFETLDEDFRCFLGKIDYYKEKVEQFRKNEGRKFSWTETARKTKLAISKL